MTDVENPETTETQEVAPPSQQGALPPPSTPAPSSMLPPSQQQQMALPIGVKCEYERCPAYIGPEDKSVQDPDTGETYCVRHAKECTTCDEFQYVGSMHEHNGDWYCESCYEERFTSCPNCEEVVDVDDILQPNNRNRYSMKYGGCTNCANKCYSCDKIISKEDGTYHQDGEDYCEDCHSEHFSYCESCNDTYDRDSMVYVEDVGEYCESCYSENFVKCEKCDKDVEKSDAQEIDDEWYCEECAEEIGPSTYQTLTENFTNFSYTKKDRFLNQLYKLLPISVKDLKTKHPALASGLNDLISFSKGKPLTPEIVKEYRDSLNPEEFPVDYTTWGGVQRSIDSLGRHNKPTDKPQLVINVLASPELLGRLQARPELYDLFDKINTVSKQSTHPYIKDQVGWIRLEPDPNGEFLLVDEIQSDHSNAAFQLKGAQDYSKVQTLTKRLREKHNLENKKVNMVLVDPNNQGDEDVKAFRAILKRRFSRTDAELDAALKAISDIPVLQGKLEEKFKAQGDPDPWVQRIIRRPEVQDDPDVQALRAAYRAINKVDDQKLDEMLENGTAQTNLTVDEANDKLNQVRNSLKNSYGLDDEGLDKLLAEYVSLLGDFPNIASQAVQRFARQNNFKKIFWHTYESGKKLKNNDPPRSLYEKTPKENFFLPSPNRPFGLDGDFLEKEAKKAQLLYKLARKLYLKYLIN